MAESRKVEPSVVEKEFFETVRPSSLLKRFATTDEVAALVAFVASNERSGAPCGRRSGSLDYLIDNVEKLFFMTRGHVLQLASNAALYLDMLHEATWGLKWFRLSITSLSSADST